MDIEKATETLQTLTRPVVTLAFTFTLCAGFILGKVTSGEFVPLAALIMGFWFTQRQGTKEAVTDKAAERLVDKMTAPKVEP